MKYTAYKGTRYEYKTVVPDKKKFGGKTYELVDVCANYGGVRGHNTALSVARSARAQGAKARVEAHSGFSAVYVR